MRKLVVDGSEYKVVHQELLCNLVLLSTSTYSQVKLTQHTSKINKKNSIRTSVGSHLPDGIYISISLVK